ncbi:MAG: hypothetical protein HRO68_07055 [Nitrosopumilus sp.]|nr:hypothetical protein [Nitrosopumilus sp.]
MDVIDNIAFNISGLPSFANFTDNGNRTATLVITPSFTDSGIYPINVTATDNGIPVLSDFEVFNLTVNNVSITSTNDFTIQHGIIEFGEFEDTETQTIIPVNQSNAFVKINNVIFAGTPDVIATTKPVTMMILVLT